MTLPLITRYRPETFEEVIGQEAAVKAIRRALDKRDAQTFLLSGPSGCGKTTIARIAADFVGCEPKDVLEVDAASHTGIDDMRNIQQKLQYRPLGKGSSRAIILDECHALSKSAWQGILKSTEDPPPNSYWFFCTTELGKVPQTLKTRALVLQLKPVGARELERLAEEIIRAEKIKLPEGGLDLILREAGGSPRQLLSNLAVCADAESRQEVASLLKTALDSDPTRELCQLLASGGSWMKAVAILNKLTDESPESVRIVVSNYMAAAALNTKTDKQALHFLSVLDAFSQSYNSSDRMAPLLLSVGRVLLGE